jgi:hypothetical protein
LAFDYRISGRSSTPEPLNTIAVRMVHIRGALQEIPTRGRSYVRLTLNGQGSRHSLAKMNMTTNNAVGAPTNSQTVKWYRRKLKQAITTIYEWRIIDAAAAQCLINRLQLWSD